MAKSKNPQANEKRAPLPKRTDCTAEFKKSWERYNRAGRRDMQEVREVMRLLWMGEVLPPQYVDHELNGEWAGCRECHIGGDFLLIYSVKKDDVIFIELGSHAELFK
ncbi:type II toxin-antitoxin system YafQ family toxin [Pseudomonas sp. LB3P31]